MTLRLALALTLSVATAHGAAVTVREPAFGLPHIYADTDLELARVWYDLANLELARGRLDEARRLYGEALTREPGDAAAHLNLGITLQRQNDRSAAEREYRAAIAADPSRREPYRALAALLAARGETAEATRLWERAQTGR